MLKSTFGIRVRFTNVHIQASMHSGRAGDAFGTCATNPHASGNLAWKQ